MRSRPDLGSTSSNVRRANSPRRKPQVATQTAGVQHDHGDSRDRGKQWRGDRRRKSVSDEKHPCHLLWGDDHWPLVGRSPHEVQRIRYETVRLGTLTVQAELAQDQLTATPRSGRQVAKRVAPSIESSLVKVRKSCGRQRSSQVRENPLLAVVGTPEGALVSQPVCDPPIQRRRRGNITHDRLPASKR